MRSGANAFYKAAAQGCAPVSGGFDCTVKVESVGDMRMPVTIAARFEDGTEQRARVDRTLRSEELRFKSKAALREVAVDPDHEYVLVDAPATVRSLALKIGDLATGIIRLERTRIADGDGDNRLRTEVVTGMFLGDRKEQLFKLGALRLRCYGNLPAGSRASFIELPPDDLWVFAGSAAP